ncbi:MAG: aspartate-semialdehyde dehydrogenase [Planctomycetes bacterium]|nr:aspartate-semialdehyde dehydrogenase [Planctomycetota bacterium]
MFLPRAPLPVAVLGATGVVGQRFVARLARHPWFRVVALAASEGNVGKRYDEACAWRLAGDAYGPAWGGLGSQRLVRASPDAFEAALVFSALDTGPARELEPAFAAAGASVFSNASAFRMDADVPLLIPEVNADHVELVRVQQKRRGTRGAIVCNPNCTATVLTLALAPLARRFGLREVIVTSFQAVSGAGYPGVASLDVLGNVLPYIRNEEEKLVEEPRKLLGVLVGDALRPAEFALSAACYRVPVLDGHTLSVSVRLANAAKLDDVRAAFASFPSAIAELGLPSAPAVPLRLHDVEDRPQVRLDVESERGMQVHVGRVRECGVLDFKFTALGHNAERGAAGASVLDAELALAVGVLSP